MEVLEVRCWKCDGGGEMLVVSELGCKKGRGIFEAGAYKEEEWSEEGVRRE
jgi:hypothetical protein